LTQAAVPFLELSNHGGAIVHVSSICSFTAFENLLPYYVSKAGVDQLTRCSALELGPRGIRVNAIHPGIIDTPMNRMAFDTDADHEQYLSKSAGLHPVGRCGAPDDLAELILFLGDSKVSGFITGQMHTVDGGRTLPAPSIQFEDKDTAGEDNQQLAAPTDSASCHV
jgi:NAD(P)-dependent dehydrogenase (short-subunit alcohol dehydrogenase family)